MLPNSFYRGWLHIFPDAEAPDVVLHLLELAPSHGCRDDEKVSPKYCCKLGWLGANNCRCPWLVVPERQLAEATAWSHSRLLFHYVDKETGLLLGIDQLENLG